MKSKFIIVITLMMLSGLLFLPMSTYSQVQELQKASLAGEWELYWMQLLTPEEIKHTDVKPGYINVPSSWGGQVIAGNTLTSHGYATYRVEVTVPSEDVGKSRILFVEYVGSAYKLWIDGELELNLGTVGTSIEEETPQFRAKLIYFQPRQETIEIVMQVSNYSFREGGILKDLQYGASEVIIPSILPIILMNILMVGGFLFIGLYHLIIYSLRRNEVSILLIGLGGFVAAVRTLFVSGYIVGFVIPIENWEILVRIEYVSELIGFMLLILLMKRLYPQEVHTIMFRISYGFTISYIAYILFTPARIFTETVIIQVAVMTIILSYFVGYVGIMAAIRKREGARLNLVALFIIIVAMLNDALVAIGIIDSPAILEYSLLNFVMFQAIIISYRYSLLFNKNTTLTNELVVMNRTLEEKVSDRTKELNEKNEELGRVQFIRTRMLANIAHDLGSPIVGIQTYLQLMKDGVVPSASPEIIQQLYGKSDDMRGLIEDLFELTKLESKEVKFEWKQFEVHAFILDVFRRFELDLDQVDRILKLGRIETAIGGRETFFRIDPLRMNRVMQNLINNAVKFSNATDKTITINCYITKEQEQPTGTVSQVRIEVIDQGIGITPDELPNVFERFYKKQDNNEHGSGLGLAIVKEIIEQHSGDIGVSSEPGHGSMFYFTLPVYYEDN